MNRELLTDKYRPQSLAELSFNPTVNSFLSTIAKYTDMPHLIVEGPRGSGKKLRVQLYLKEKYGSFPTFSRTLNMDIGKSTEKAIHTLYSTYHHQLNPSIHNIYDRSLMQCFTSEIIHTRLIANIPYRIIVIEDADLLSIEAQESLRRTLETCIRNCRFIFLVNNEDTMIPALYSRCITIKVSAPTVDEIVDILEKAAVAEGATLGRNILRDIASASGRNLQTSLHTLNKLLITNSKVFSRAEYDNIYRYGVEIVDTIIKGQNIVTIMDKVRTLLYEIVNYCVDCKKLLPLLLNITLDKLPNNAHNERYELCCAASERDESIRISSKDIYHIESFCLYILKTVKSLMLTKQRQTTKVKTKI